LPGVGCVTVGGPATTSEPITVVSSVSSGRLHRFGLFGFRNTSNTDGCGTLAAVVALMQVTPRGKVKTPSLVMRMSWELTEAFSTVTLTPVCVVMSPPTPTKVRTLGSRMSGTPLPLASVPELPPLAVVCVMATQLCSKFGSHVSSS
jgi:hypothetical protein